MHQCINALMHQYITTVMSIIKDGNCHFDEYPRSGIEKAVITGPWKKIISTLQDS